MIYVVGKEETRGKKGPLFHCVIVEIPSSEVCPCAISLPSSQLTQHNLKS